MSGAIYRTDLSWPAIVAYELGPDRRRVPLPDLRVADRPGRAAASTSSACPRVREPLRGELDFWEIVSAGALGRSLHGRIEDYWERGAGSAQPPGGPPFHNMAVYGWDVLDARLLDADIVSRADREPPRTISLNQVRRSDNGTAPAWSCCARGPAGAPAPSCDGRGAMADRRRDRDPGRDAGRQQRPGLRGRPGALLDAGRLRRPDPRRAAAGGQGRVQRVAARALRRRLGRCW